MFSFPEMAVLLWKSFHRVTNGRLLQRRSVSLYNHTHGFEEEEIRKKLQQFPGGSISLSREDDGIGILTLNNPKLMNAFTVVYFIVKLWTKDIPQQFFLFMAGTMMIELQERVAELENWRDGKGLIVHGAENTFCSGSDLNAVRMLSSPQAITGRKIKLKQLLKESYFFKALVGECHALEWISASDQDGMNMCMFMQNILTRLMRLPLITVALVQGRALGGGAELITACDFR
ncbi:hypothetical protein lerEdw1_018046 [Lerista edwardsae]|nr:hypothetical protein lerEdw1_018046 [Lerista edwardsae]